MSVTSPTWRLSNTPRFLLVAAVAWIASAGGFIAAASGQTQVIPLRSGDGLSSVWDQRASVSDRKTISELVVPEAASPALAVSALNGSRNPLSLDPAARWIGPAARRDTTGRTVVYATPFTVNNGRIGSADISYVARTDGSPAHGQLAELRLNDHPVGEIPMAASGLADEWVVVADVGPWLTTGVNWLTIQTPASDLGGAVIFSARVSIWPEADAPEVAEDQATEHAAAEGIFDCVGFTCRPRGDWDSDHYVDLFDYSRFTECLSGAGLRVSGECEYADFDCDGQVDLVDVGLFQVAFTGP